MATATRRRNGQGCRRLVRCKGNRIRGLIENCLSLGSSHMQEGWLRGYGWLRLSLDPGQSGRCHAHDSGGHEVKISEWGAQFLLPSLR